MKEAIKEPYKRDCKRCNKCFITKDPRKIFCCNQCASAYGSMRLRMNKRARPADWYERVDRKNSLRRLYGITLEEYDKMLSDQEYRCAICDKHQDEFKKKLHVDHCHTTGKIRGLLCQKCNQGLGLFGDNKNLLIKASEYLK